MFVPFCVSRRGAGVCALLFLFFMTSTAVATTLHQAFSAANQYNAQLQAQRAGVAAAKDQVDSAYSGWKPKVGLSAGVGRTHLDGQFSSLFGAFGGGSVMPIGLHGSYVGVSFTQPVYHAGATNAAIDRAQHHVEAQTAQLYGAQQQVFLAVAQAYIHVLTDQKVLKLERHNMDVLTQQLQSAKANLQAGEATHTDVAQSQSRLAGARAKVIEAQGDIKKARATYKRLVGQTPHHLEAVALPKYLPPTLAAALQAAAHNYSVQAAHLSLQAAQDNVEATPGAFSPTVSVTGAYTHANDPQFAFAQMNRAEIALNVSIPLYQGGSLSAKKSHAQHLASRYQHEWVAAKRRAAEQVMNIWQSYQTTQAALKAIESQISAARIAFKGVRNEHRVGERTQLDVLNAQQDLLGARVRRARVHGRLSIAAYALQAATGALAKPANHASP